LIFKRILYRFIKALCRVSAVEKGGIVYTRKQLQGKDKQTYSTDRMATQSRGTSELEHG
jgi:hypothetical protein